MKILYNLVLMSISGSMMFLLSALLHKQMRQRFARWYYALLVTAAAMFIIPLQALFSSHKIFKVSVPASDTIVSGGMPYTSVHISNIAVSPAQLIIMLWAAVSFILICITIFKYFKVSRSLKRISRECYNSDILEAFSEVKNNMRIYREIELRISRNLDSPLLFGVLRPIVIVPERDFTHNELVMIFTHELTHYKHCDLAIKLMMSVSRCIHFFNPAVYFLSKAINEGCELCCDESVLDRLNLSDKKDYGRLIISVIESPDRAMAYSTAMASPKDKIQKRLLKIIEFRSPSKLLKMFSVMLAVSVSLCSLTALGFEAAKEALPEEVTETITNILSEPVIEPVVESEKPTPIAIAAAALTPAATATPVPEQKTAAPTPEAVTEEPVITTAVSNAIEMPGASYVFNPVFADGITEVRSDSISVAYDMFASITRSNGNEDCILKVYKINSDGTEELVYGESSSDTGKNNLSIRFLQGETFYIVAQQNNGAERANIYVHAS
ncbi:MAG: M56 family metallopeptidase [Oscillospiraceae bacterium]|nr:M56 family metallopeptidase [Oscillospiraceae bacterium]